MATQATNTSKVINANEGTESTSLLGTRIDSPSNAATTIGSANPVVNAKLVSIVNGGVEVNAIFADGSLRTGSNWPADLGTFGAVQASTTGSPAPLDNNSDAFEAAIDSLSQDMGYANTPIGTVFVPPGRYWVNRPIWLKNKATRFTGAGREQTIVGAANAGSNLAGHLEGFAGPLVVAGQLIFPTTYGPDLFGGSGRSLEIVRAEGTAYVLHDAWAWSQMSGMTALAIEGTFKVTDLSADNRQAMLQSESFDPTSSLTNTASSCFTIQVANSGGGFYFEFTLSTSNGNGFTATSAVNSVVEGNTYHLSMNYDGTHLDCFVDGISVGHVSCTGTVFQRPWQNVTLGGFLAGPDAVGGAIATLGFQVQSMRFSFHARHTGTGSFTPPSAPYVVDSDTIALYNWDQGDAPAGAPWVIGQVYPPPGIGGGLHKHYVRNPAVGFTEQVTVDNISITANRSCSGLILGSSPLSRVDNFAVHNGTKYGIYHGGATAFFSSHQDVFVNNCITIGYWASTYASSNITIVGGEIQSWFPAGVAHAINTQPGSNTIFPMIIGGAGFGNNTGAALTLFNVDAEGVFPVMQAALLLAADCTNLNTRECAFSTLGASGAPPNVLIAGLGAGGWLSQSDFFQSPGTAGLIEKVGGAVVTGEISIDHPRNFGGETWTSTLVGSILKPATSVLA